MEIKTKWQSKVEKLEVTVGVGWKGRVGEINIAPLIAIART